MNPGYIVAESLAKLCPVAIWEAKFVKDELGHGAEEISKQSVEDAAWFLLATIMGWDFWRCWDDVNVFCTWDRHESLKTSGQPLWLAEQWLPADGHVLIATTCDPYMAKGTLLMWLKYRSQTGEIILDYPSRHRAITRVIIRESPPHTPIMNLFLPQKKLKIPPCCWSLVGNPGGGCQCREHTSERAEV